MMNKQNVVKSILKASGQSQPERNAEALSEQYVSIDEWTKSDLMDYMQAFAQHVNFYQDDSKVPTGNWQSFFPFNTSQSQQYIEQNAPNVHPHIALLQAFVELYKYPQEQINKLTASHLDFYYKTVLKMSPNAAVNDKAHLVLSLKKNSANTVIDPSHSFSAGKDTSGIERIYQPTKTNIINHALVSSIKSVFIDPIDNKVKHAPIANSQDGLGEELSTQNGSWAGFGKRNLPVCNSGFAISSKVLLLSEGDRTIIVKIDLIEASVSDLLSGLSKDQLINAFLVSFSGEKGWLEPIAATPKISNSSLELTVEISNVEEPISSYQNSVHGYNFETAEPVMQVWVNQEHHHISYLEYAKLQIENIQIFTKVKGAKKLNVENDFGKLDAKKAFMPFGAQPHKGMRFYIGHDESLNKKLSFLGININWQDTPINFSVPYKRYKTKVTNSIFKVSVSFNDAGNWQESVVNRRLFNTKDATELSSMTFGRGIRAIVSLVPATQMLAVALSNSNQQWAKASVAKMRLTEPTLSTFVNNTFSARKNTTVISTLPVKKGKKTEPSNYFRNGFITLALERDFLHEEYRLETVKNALSFSKSGTGTPIILKEPYTPSIADIALDYTAYTDQIDMDTNVSSFANDELLFFHLSYSGQLREHGYIRSQFDYITDKNVSLVPAYQYNGELLIGIRNLSANDGINLLVTVAEGSADPEKERATIEWSVLSDNYWQPLNEEALIDDTTNGFLTSGIISIVIPSSATIDNTVLPHDAIWLKAGLIGDVNAVCDIINIYANGIEVVFCDENNSADHLNAPIPANTIAKLKTPVTTIKSVGQPMASFGGKPQENNTPFRTRVAERLRHKNRAITLWDIERILLDKFPSVFKVKCLPHSSPNNWNAPGHVTAIMIPNLYNQNAVDPFRPKVSTQTIAIAEKLLASLGGMQVQYHVTNPRYFHIRIGFGVKFHIGFEFNYYAKLLNQKIIEFLTPWMRATEKDIYFGGIVFKSEILDFVEELPFVDYLTDFTLIGYENENELLRNHVKDESSISVTEPDMIMVSAKEHDIYQVES